MAPKFENFEMKEKPETQTVNATYPEMDENAVQGAAEVAKKLPLFGHVVWLYTQSPASRYFFIQDMESRVLPPVILDQCKLHLQSSGGSLPVAYISWAYLSDEAEEKFIATQRIAPNDWKSGENIWLIDVLAPFGGEQAILKELLNDVLNNREVSMLYPSLEGGLEKRTLSDLMMAENDKSPSSHTGDTTKH